LQNPEVAAWWGKFTQMSASPGDAHDLMHMNVQIDIGGILPTIRVPTLVIHANRDKVAPIEAGRYFAEHIPGARMLELDSIDHWPYFGDADVVLGEIQEFLTGARSSQAPETMLATVLCTNVAQAGAHAVWLGGKQWHDLVERHHAAWRRTSRRASWRRPSLAMCSSRAPSRTSLSARASSSASVAAASSPAWECGAFTPRVPTNP